MPRTLALLGLVLGCSVTLACGSSNEPAQGTGGTGGTAGTSGDAGPEQLSFSPCPLLGAPFTAPPSGPVTTDHGFDGKPSPINEWGVLSTGTKEMASAMAECATAKLPAVWSDPHGDTIDVFVKRYPALVQPAKGQIWLLQGGPGCAGSIFETLAFLARSTIPDFDIYLPDHRGTGKSSLATCAPGATPAACAASVPHLDGLTATDAARDIAWLIDATRTSSQQVFVHGNSYGTYWAQRYLQIRPDQPTAVILDSTVPPQGFDWADFDKHFDAKAHAVLAICQADATCLAKLGPDPVATAKEALAVVDAGKCAAGVGDFRAYLGDLVGDTYLERLLMPASVYRVLRCNAADRAWLAKVAAYRRWWNGLISGYSIVVADNIISSEFWQTNPSALDLWSQEKDMLAVVGGLPGMATIWDSWPRYPRDAYYGRWPTSPVPILVLQGGLDPRTPYGDVVKTHYSGTHQYYVELPLSAHVPAWPLASPMADLAAPGCGWQIVKSFIADPMKAPDTSCISGMAPLDFGNPPPQWLAVVGIKDLWENDEADAGSDAATDAGGDGE